MLKQRIPSQKHQWPFSEHTVNSYWFCNPLTLYHWYFLEHELGFSHVWCVIQFFALFIGNNNKKRLPTNCSAESSASVHWGSGDTISVDFGHLFRRQSPVGNGASRGLQHSCSPGCKQAIWYHQSQLWFGARRVQNVIYPCCFSHCTL